MAVIRVRLRRCPGSADDLNNFRGPAFGPTLSRSWTNNARGQFFAMGRLGKVCLINALTNIALDY